MLVRIKIIILGIIALGILSGCAMNSENNSNKNNLKEKYWKLVDYNGENVQYPEKFTKEPFIIFKEEGRISGNGGCNIIIGGYEIKGNNIKFSPIATTKMLCGEEDNKIEYKFLKFLNVSTPIKYELIEDMLILKDKNNILIFKTVVL